MDPRSAATRAPDPDAIEFVRFCYRRRRVGWPELYDEMCAVAGRALFRGYDADDLSGIGIGFTLFDMPGLAAIAAEIVSEEQAQRRPVRVVLAAEPPVTEPAVQEPVSVPVSSPPSLKDERAFDVPIRLSLVPSGA
ncbi:MAG: hypothetical protein ACJ77V_07925 [Chloroflexota bacterium]|jgi:hypothetical protein